MDFGILMIKPNGFAPQVLSEINKQLSTADLTTQHQTDVQLTVDEARRISLYRDEAYIRWLTSTPVRFILVRGVSPIDKLYLLKKRVREKFNAGLTKRNLLHSSDEGTEYSNLLSIGFPHLKPQLYCNSSDMLVPYCSESAEILLPSQRISSIVFGFQKLPADVRTFSRGKDIILAEYCNVASPIPHQIWKWKTHVDRHGTINYNQSFDVLNILKIDTEHIEEYYSILVAGRKHKVLSRKNFLIRQLPIFGLCDDYFRKGVRGLICFRPDLTILESELLMDLAKLSSLSRLGGSGGVEVGKFGISGTFPH
ncbi:hypothetical protein LAV84_23940 [Rhizobium sp. VS19-DR104.2]|uniref:hypothetical protein n=1 Tax=unclassified Rhizobium TaxID=2613769 RepID=UPI001CC7751C|nr:MULTISPECIES: hypothetical protein [unclassified Rhizobium]MBZ5762311.1 hypothetical protein [Rhizobium sp. VS19-DR96]MBZ5768327.1 hypothetical protein [Rhizobium sp. VS19-DR129.2]MBZ5775801.1 hypothetical protein [Rhizobium sp. VS19-DRK62.2]MBZ5787178.1 hypothetical protein [Rhizobium sp. VS19-DR121]MBZ5804253.1 hypothetical protein [Rhizobium sp. VS19-DR181]